MVAETVPKHKMFNGQWISFSEQKIIEQNKNNKKRYIEKSKWYEIRKITGIKWGKKKKQKQKSVCVVFEWD